MTQTKTEPDNEADLFIEQMARKHKRNQRIIGAFVLVLIGASAWALYQFKFKDDLYRISLKVEQLKQQTAPPPDALTSIHTTLLPDWFILESQLHANPKLKNKAKEAHGKIINALGKDKTGILIFTELNAKVSDRKNLGKNHKPIMALVKQWNQHMAALKQPWWIDANIMSTRKNTFFYTKSYKVISDVQIKVGSKPHRTRVVARVDKTNIRESMLGHTKPGQDGAIVLADRIYDFALRDIWPLLSQDEKLHTPKQAKFAPLIRKELQQRLNPTSWNTLQQTALHRRKITAALDSIRKRQSCGNTFSVGKITYIGVDLENYKILRSYARRDQLSTCPSITQKEANMLLEASDALRDTSDLRVAVEELVAFISRGISIHEARHDADHHQMGGFDNPLPCEPCEGILSRSARAELSAYLASFAVKGTSYTALYQACSIDLKRRTPHANAMRQILPGLKMKSCEDTIPENLSKQAQELEMTFFGRSQMVTLPDNYPGRIELYIKR